MLDTISVRDGAVLARNGFTWVMLRNSITWLSGCAVTLVSHQWLTNSDYREVVSVPENKGNNMKRFQMYFCVISSDGKKISFDNRLLNHMIN